MGREEVEMELEKRLRKSQFSAGSLGERLKKLSVLSDG